MHGCVAAEKNLPPRYWALLGKDITIFCKNIQSIFLLTDFFAVLFRGEMADIGRFGADMGRTGKEALNQSVGQAVAKYRKAVGMTQAELAERLDLSLDAVSRLERGNIGLSVARLVELAEIFGCETVDLLSDGSTRPRDQARQLEALLVQLEEHERISLLDLIRQMVAWKRS